MRKSDDIKIAFPLYIAPLPCIDTMTHWRGHWQFVTPIAVASQVGLISSSWSYNTAPTRTCSPTLSQPHKNATVTPLFVLSSKQLRMSMNVAKYASMNAMLPKVDIIDDAACQYVNDSAITVIMIRS